VIVRRTGHPGLVGRRRILLAAVLCGVLAAISAGSAVEAAPQRPDPKPLRAQSEPLGHAGSEIKGSAPAVPVYKSMKVSAAVWPAAGTASVSPQSAKIAGSMRAGKLPVWLAGPASVSVEMLDHSKAPAGITAGRLQRQHQPTGVPVCLRAVAFERQGDPHHQR
jgi:hypothetical protein